MSETDRQLRTVAVIGAGAWGTTLAWLLGNQGHRVRLWTRRAEHSEQIRREGENRLRLPGTALPPQVMATGELTEALRGAECVVSAVPSAHLREVAGRMAGLLDSAALVVSATKGLEPGTGKRMSQLLAEEAQVSPEHLVALSGPNLSGEIVAGMPAVSVVAGSAESAVAEGQRLLSSPLFRIYANYDILGVEICGALKNVLAIAAGVSDGLGYGANARAALVTRGLTEMGRIGHALGACRATFWGAAGVGDVLTTCNSRLSRNWQAGHRLGCGEALTAEGSEAIEGVPTTRAARELSQRLGVEAPISCALYEVLFEGRAPGEAVMELMCRPWRAEAEAWQ